MKKLINKESVLEIAKGFTFTDKAQERQYMDFLKYCLDNANDNYKPLTNADHIRNMTDEELADFLYEFSYESVKELCEWLKSEVGCE